MMFGYALNRAEYDELTMMKELLAEVAKRCPFGRLPDNYVVFDTETTGVRPSFDYVLQYGFCFVIERRQVDSFAQIIKRRHAIPLTSRAVEIHGITPERMAYEGVDPSAVVPSITNTFEAYRQKRFMFVGHNLMAFDAPLFERECLGLGVPFQFRDDEVIDTGMLVKAAQLKLRFHPGETLGCFYRRVSGIIARGVFWSLDKHCIKTYALDKCGVDCDKAHDAAVDCQLTHHLFEKLRVLGGG
jgi:DNA polymerase III epsilon subunit-like protein